MLYETCYVVWYMLHVKTTIKIIVVWECCEYTPLEFFSRLSFSVDRSCVYYVLYMICCISYAYHGTVSSIHCTVCHIIYIAYVTMKARVLMILQQKLCCKVLEVCSDVWVPA